MKKISKEKDRDVRVRPDLPPHHPHNLEMVVEVSPSGYLDRSKSLRRAHRLREDRPSDER